MVFLHALGGIFSLLAVVTLGYLLAWRGWFPEPCRKLIPRLVTNISLPPFLACTIIESLDRSNLLHLVYGTALPLVAMCLLFAIAYAAGKVLHISKRHFGLFCACVSNPNTIFIGIPVNMALFGAEALPFVLIYYFASTFFFWTIGNYFISHDAHIPPQPAPGHRGIHWRQLLSPPIYGFLSGVCVVCLNIPIPDFIFQAARIIGEMTTPLALLFIGLMLQTMNLRQLRLSRDIVFALAGRMILSPILVWLLLPFFALPDLMGKVFIIQSSLPVLMQVAILSAYYNTDPEYGSIMVSLSTILCAITVPFYMWLL